MMLCRPLRWLGPMLALLLWSAPVRAADFKTHYNLALALYQAQRYEEAIPEFKAAYEQEPKPGLLLNLAQAYRKSGHPREAIENYERYLKADPAIDDETRRKVEGYQAEARNTLAVQEREIQQRLEAEKAARERDAWVTAPVVRPAPAAPAPVVVAAAPVAAPSAPVYKRWWFWTTIGGVAAAGVIVGVVVGTQLGGGNKIGDGVPRGSILLAGVPF